MNDNYIYLTLENVIGENTGKSYDGTFKVQKYLTNKERSSVSRYLETLCRDIERDTNLILLMQAISHMKVHTAEAPSWWTDSENGLNLMDTEPVFKLYSLLLQAQRPAVKKEEEKTEPVSEKTAS
ncbi:hypothetical protein UFOVP244_181 [uncultured Caudovirales phage]|uniref:Uncharacterized protein n=1 Tax=uncultured Caudovirales phage TaxID=2100421 RepID=A0A6J7WZM0_9CAUD|nr:hypothetical protein UFOVP244_181 [uncultured Caudovirales phage]